MAYIPNPPKIDEEATLGLAGTSNSLAYRIHEIEKHFHNSEQAFGNSANAMAADVPVKFTVTGGNNDWGTEILLTNGTVIESGSSVKKFDLNTLYIVDVSAANKISIVEISASPLDLAVPVVTDIANDRFELTLHEFIDGDKVIVNNIITTTGLNTNTVYYVINAHDPYFQLSLTPGGSAVALNGGNGSCDIYKFTSPVGTKTVVSMSATNSDSMPFKIMMPRVPCNSAVSIRAKSESGSTVSIGFLLGLHVYPS